MNRNELSSLLHEWDSTPEACPAMADRLMERIRSTPKQDEGAFSIFWPAAPAVRVRFGLLCLLLGVGAGAAYAEWVTLRNDDLMSSEMSSRYLHSINPKYHEASAGVRP